jgi:hypothetical protein
VQFRILDPVTTLKLETEKVDSHHSCQPSVSCENCAPTKSSDAVSDPMTCSVEKIPDSKKRTSRKNSNSPSTKKRVSKKQVLDTVNRCEESHKKKSKVSEQVVGSVGKSNEIDCHSSGLLEKSATDGDLLEMLNTTPKPQSEIVNQKVGIVCIYEMKQCIML